MTELELQNVSFTYSVGTPFAHRALCDVSLRFQGGVITGLMGHTGCGKSTLVQMLNGLLKPDSGKVLLDGKDIWEDPKKIRDVRFRVGLVFQYPEYQLFEETVEKDIAFGPRNIGLGEEEIAQRVRSAIHFVGLDEALLTKSPFELSGGQKRRVAIAGILAMDPDVLILDEPAAGLDPMGREEILGGVWSYQRKRKNTVIIVSHSMDDMARYADRIAVMDHGKVIREGRSDDIFSMGDELVRAGLDLPAVTKIANRLRACGIPLGADVNTVESARSAILTLLNPSARRDR